MFKNCENFEKMMENHKVLIFLNGWSIWKKFKLLTKLLSKQLKYLNTVLFYIIFFFFMLCQLLRKILFLKLQLWNMSLKVFYFKLAFINNVSAAVKLFRKFFILVIKIFNTGLFLLKLCSKWMIIIFIRLYFFLKCLIVTVLLI